MRNRSHLFTAGKRTKAAGNRLWKTALVLVLLLTVAGRVPAQESSRVLSGTVVDKHSQPLAGVLVDQKESLISVFTDRHGNFTIRTAGETPVLIFTLEGYKQQQVTTTGSQEKFEVILVEGEEASDPYVYLMYGKQRASRMASAVSYVSGQELEDIPLTQLTSMLTGKLSGVLTLQKSGAPNQDESELYLRGRRSWRNSKPLVFVDGHLRPISQIDPHEIEQVTAYKDAASLAIFGLRGGNGAIMATTKRGVEGRPVLSFNSQVSIQQPIRLPDMLDSWHYATLYNEGMLNDDPTATPMYSEEDLAKYLDGSDPYTHPDVDWLGTFLKKNTVSHKHNMSIRGGSSVAKYFVNMAFQNNNGMYRTDELNTYSTKANYKMYSVRSNTDVKLSRTTELAINLYGRQFIQNNPGSTLNSNAIMNTLYSLAPNVFPVNYGEDKVAGTNDMRTNPYGILNHSGYSRYIHSTMEASMELKENLDYFLPGLSVRGSLAYDLRFDNTINRSKTYQVYQYTGTNAAGEPEFQVWGEEGKQNNSNSFGSQKIRIFDVEAGLDYSRTFGKHDVAATLIYNYNQFSDDTQTLPNYHQGIAGRALYAYDSRYLAEFTFGYQGTEQLPPSKRYGFFPAGAVGWIISNESFIRDREIGRMLSLLKIRASYGLAGNDDGLPYYYYLPAFRSRGTRYYFGTTGSPVTGWDEDTTNGLANQSVTWEKSAKLNLGIDLGLFNDRLTLGFDWFDERTSQILTTRTSVSTLLGMGAGNGPLANVGKTKNQGYEATLHYSDRIGEVRLHAGGNIGYARNEIVFNDEQTYNNEYRQRAGHAINSLFGYVADGLYRDQQDIDNSPLTNFGPVLPGDIKYRDLNSDGVVDINDETYLGHGNLAEINYSFYAGARFRGFDFNVQFAGVANRDFILNEGVGITAFYNATGSAAAVKYRGGARQYHWDNRYNPNDASTWETAKYPRLSVGERNHNRQQSSFWVDNGAFLRLKNLEFGYTLPDRITRQWYISRLRVFYSGHNLFTWDKMRTLDPENVHDGSYYPVQKIHSFGVNIQF